MPYQEFAQQSCHALYSYAFDRVCVIAQGKLSLKGGVNFFVNSKLALRVTVQVQAEVATINQ